MEYLIICATTFIVSVITLFSGFGLGTVLVPVFALFFPLSLSIAAVAVVHLLNNIFKAFLVGKFASLRIVLLFGIPAAAAALAGAFLLGYFAQLPPLLSYRVYGLSLNITLIGLTVGTLVIASSLFELVPRLARLSVPPRYIPLGGALSGFFGGLSGYQGTLRAAFLIKSGLDTEHYIGTCAICSIIVDTARLSIYGWAAYTGQFSELKGVAWLLLAASLTAFLGSYIGSKWIGKVAFKALQIFIGIMLIALGFILILGIGES